MRSNPVPDFTKHWRRKDSGDSWKGRDNSTYQVDVPVPVKKLLHVQADNR